MIDQRSEEDSPRVRGETGLARELSENFGPSSIGSIAAVLLSVLSVIWLLLPAIYSDEIRSAINDLPREAHHRLASISGYRAKANELLARFWERRALRSDLSDPFNAALINRPRALETFSTDVRRRNAGHILAARTAALREPLRHGNQINAMAFSPDGQGFFTTTGDGRLNQFHIADSEIQHVSTRWCYGKSLNSPFPLDPSGNRARVWDFVTGNRVCIREIQFDAPDDGDPIKGDPTELLQSWLDRTALKFAEGGVTLAPKFPLPRTEKGTETLPRQKEP